MGIVGESTVMAKRFCIRPQVYCGRESLDTVLAGTKRALIVTDHFMHENGIDAYLTVPLAQGGVEYTVFSGVTGEPTMGMVAEGINVLAAFQPDTLYAFGGGSAIDAAKAMCYLLMRKQGSLDVRFVAIPTTSGTGSEVSSYAVITDEKESEKYPIADDAMLPDMVLLDAQLCVSVPPSVTADSGMDVLTHAIEAYVSERANDFTDAAAEKAARLVFENLYQAYKNPGDLEARQKVHDASCLAGIAFNNASLGLNHGMAHTLGSHFHIPHGRANAVLLPYVMHFNAGCDDKLTPTAARYAELAKVLSLDSTSIRGSALNLIRSVRQYVVRLQIPDRISRLGISEKDFMAVLEEMVDAALADGTTAGNPRPVTRQDVRELFLKAYRGRYTPQ